MEEEVLKNKEYIRLECKFEGQDRWVRNHTSYESFEKAARAGSVIMNQEDVEDYRLLRVEEKVTLIHA